MTIVLTGGGSGGHITPILAVAEEIKQRQPDAKLIYIGQTGDKLGDIPNENPCIDEVYSVRAGKFRRYHGEGLKQLLDIPTLFKNIRDVFYVIAGIYQSRRLLKKLEPQVVFIKGGFVGLPVGLAAAWLRLPYVTHDSDAIPGLANRVIARWAALHAVALPADLYKYPADKTVTTGIPLRKEFQPVTEADQQKFKQDLNIPPKSQLLFVIGGGLGSQTVNHAVAEAVPHLMREYSNLHVIHAVGRANETEMKSAYQEKLTAAEQGRLKILSYINDVYRYSGAADLVITRAGATNLAEFALQGRACIVVPSSFLAGGHQLKNAAYLEEKQAASVISESQLAADPNRLSRIASQLLKDDNRRREMAKNLARFAKPDASAELADLILKQART